MQRTQPFNVQSLKYDGHVQKSWAARLKRREGSLIVLDASFDEEVRHPILGTIEAGTPSLEYFWTDRWYSVFRLSEPGGLLRCFYCNVNKPALLEGRVLSYVDLDVDVLVQPDYSFIVLDVEEFEENAKLYNYPHEYRVRVRDSLEELSRLINERQFPFI